MKRGWITTPSSQLSKFVCLCLISHVIQPLFQFKDALEADLEKGGEGRITKDDIFIIFSKFNKIIQVWRDRNFVYKTK